MTRDEAEARVSTAITPDGGLTMNEHWYISWVPGEDDATLDGDFTIEELEAIVRHIRATVKQ